MDKVLPAAEQAKVSAKFLRGTLAEELQTDSPEFSKPSIGVLKFHGIYQQDDRDVRKVGPKQFSDMVRVGVPGGVLTTEQYLTLDRLANLGDGSLRVTTRQDIQYHYIPKTRVAELIRGLNESYLSTLAACGDVVRNTVGCPAPFETSERRNIQPVIEFLSKSLKPKTSAYYDIWIDGERAISAEEDSEPLYGATYLPRKFKIAFAFPGVNTTDIYANDIGVVPHFADGQIAGYTILAGGGMGQSAGVKTSHPRLADPICAIGPSKEELLEVCTAIVTIHRDFGNRTNRKLARLKYVMDAWGVPKFKAEVEARVGRPLADPAPLVWNSADDFLGWHKQTMDQDGTGKWFVGVRIVSGRIRDFNEKHRFRTGLRDIVSRFGLEVRLTCQQNLYLCGIAEADREAVASALEGCGLMAADKLPPVLRHAIACPALPTCGQAITESERILPNLVSQIQDELSGAGLGDEAIHFRTSGCPNGCSRPYTAEIGIVGASVDMYTIYLGASSLGTRLGFVFATNVKRDDIVPRLKPVLSSFKETRHTSETFGDFCHRTLQPSA